MFLEDTTHSGEEWLFGTTRSILSTSNGKRVVLWKIKLNSSHNPILTDTSVAASFRIHDGDIGNTGYVAGVRPTFDSAGCMHLIWNGDLMNMHYMVFNWVKGDNTSSKFLYPDVILTPMRAFWVGTKNEVAQGITFY